VQTTVEAFRWDTLFVERFRLGDAAALRAVYVVHAADVARVARRFLGARSPSADVDDVVQEVFARAFTPRARAAFDATRRYGPYVGTLARNVSINWAIKRRQEVVLADLDALAAEAPEDPSLSAACTEAMEALARHVMRLPSGLRRIHELRYIEGRTQREASLTLGISRQELRTKELRLLAALRREIAHCVVPR
jgi:RNA polymerase sigma-70 factor (ECF subfamily)